MCVDEWASALKSGFYFPPAFSTIAWEDLKDCATAGRRESHLLDSQVRGKKEVPEKETDFLHNFDAYIVSIRKHFVIKSDVTRRQRFITSRLLMFDAMCWNPARMRPLFARGTQTTANWPDLTRFVHL